MNWRSVVIDTIGTVLCIAAALMLGGCEVRAHNVRCTITADSCRCEVTP